MSNGNSSPAEQKAALRCYPIEQWYEFVLQTKAPNGSPGPMRYVYEAVVQMVFHAWQACYETPARRDEFIEIMVIRLENSLGMAIGKLLYHEASLNISSPSFLNLVIEARDQASRVLSVCESIRDDKDADLNLMERMAAARPFDPYELIPPLRKAINDYITRTANPGAFPMLPFTVDEIAAAVASRGKAVGPAVPAQNDMKSFGNLELQQLALALGDDTAAKMMKIANKQDLNTNEKLGLISTLDKRYYGFQSPALAELLKVSAPMIRQTKWWRVDRKVWLKDHESFTDYEDDA